MIPVLFVVTILVFSIIRFIPGEPARLILGEKATEEAVAALTEKLGLNEPLLTQYLLFLKQIFTLDFGNSFTYQMPVSELLASRFPVTLALTLMSTVISLVISCPGLFCRRPQGPPGRPGGAHHLLAGHRPSPPSWVGLRGLIDRLA